MVGRSAVRSVDDFCGWEVPNGSTPSVTPEKDDDNKLRQFLDRIRENEVIEQYSCLHRVKIRQSRIWQN